jgi:hypothetical protein
MRPPRELGKTGHPAQGTERRAVYHVHSLRQ